MTLKDEGCSECHISMKIGCSQPVAPTAVSYFAKFGTYGGKKKIGRLRTTATGDESMTW